MTTATAERPADVNLDAGGTGDELLLIDLSSILHPIWHMSQAEPDPDATAIKTVDRVHQLASRFPTAAVCCDSPTSWRKQLDPTYKAQRPAQDAPLRHQMRVAIDRLRADGFPVWVVDGFEADDLIATATMRALAIEGSRVLIATGDKDLLQLVSDRVTAKSVRDGSLLDPAGVATKFGITPTQMRDYLCLVGDSSDNIKGAQGIGPKGAVALLTQFGSIEAVYKAMDAGTASLKDGAKKSLTEFRTRWPNVLKLITLRTDVEIPFEEIAAERRPKDATPDLETDGLDDAPAPPTMPAPIAPPVQPFTPTPPTGANGNGHGHGHAAPAPASQPAANQPSQALVPATPDVLAPPAAEWEKQLEPRSPREAQALATAMYQARMFNGYGSPPAVLSTIMAGRELGLQAIASLRGFHIVEGRHALAADLIRGLVLRSGLADYFKCIERTNEGATFKTHRKDDPDPTPTTLTYTIEDGRVAFGFTADMKEAERVAKEAKWKASGWGKNPADMCVARAGSKLARLVYPEVSFGLYAPEELE